MGKESYSSWLNKSDSNRDNNKSNNMKVGYFSLKDGEEATVRFCYDTVDQIEIISTHNLKSPAYKYGRTVSCIRGNDDPIEKCPICENGDPVEKKFYVKMLQYVKVKDEEGNTKIEVQPKIWERRAGYAKTIADLIREYSQLGFKNCVFKIKRSGSSLDTTYSIMYGPSEIYREENYPKSFELIENFDVAKYIDRSYEDLVEFLETGELPRKGSSSREDKIDSNAVVEKKDTTYSTANTPVHSEMDRFVESSEYTKSQQRRVAFQQPQQEEQKPQQTTNRPTRWY